MARSPLFRALKRFVSEHAAAADQGVGVARIREEIGRGDFLRRAGAASLAGAAVPLFAACGSSHARGRERIAIVGAGIAGLTAALRLKDAGIALHDLRVVGPRRRPDALELDAVGTTGSTPNGAAR